MAYINVAEWSPDQVTDWLKGKTIDGVNILQQYTSAQQHAINPMMDDGVIRVDGPSVGPSCMHALCRRRRRRRKGSHLIALLIITYCALYVQTCADEDEDRRHVCAERVSCIMSVDRQHKAQAKALTCTDIVYKQ